MRTLICSLTLLITFSLQAQENQDIYKELSKLILHKINNLRIEQNVDSLYINDALSRAAGFHSRYMGRYNRLKHEESSSKNKTPYKRVQKYSKEYELVGENILFVSHKGSKVKAKNLESIASEMFSAWKNSPTHYENMINPQFTMCGFGFALGKDKLYATNVFGAKGYSVDGQFSTNAFGIEPYNSTCNTFLSKNNNLITNIGNSLMIEGNDVVLYVHNKKLIDKMFTKPEDGIAIDIVTKDQFANKETNMLDFSHVYDGVMLKPIYRDEIKKRNSSEGDFRYIGTIANIPESFLQKDINANLIFIKDGVACKYKYPASIPRDDYNLLNVNPILLNPDHPPFLTKGISSCHTITFNFDRGKTVPVENTDLSKYKGTIKQVQITSYSSIEGDSTENVHLQKQRAEYIREYISKTLGTSNFKYTTKTKENWDLMRFQLKVLGLDSLVNSPKRKIQNFITNNTQHNWDSLLYIQRKSYATIYFENTLNKKDSLYFSQNYHSAMFYSKNDLVNRSLSSIYNHSSLQFFSFTPSERESVLTNPYLVQNTAAILTKIYNYDFAHTVQFLDHWLNRMDSLNKDTKYNLCILYCKVVTDILDSWDVSKKTFSKIIPPYLIENYIPDFADKKEYNHLLLNYHITASRYYGQNNDYSRLTKSFNFIVNYFKNKSLNIDDEIKLCMFFNNWSRDDLCIHFLMKRMNGKDFNEDAAFLLAQTSLAYPDILSSTELNNIAKKAFQMNKDRWCSWINQEFQHQRNPFIKDIYCNECEQNNNTSK